MSPEHEHLSSSMEMIQILGTNRCVFILYLHDYFAGVRCQMSLLYSSIVLSEEKYPAFAIFTSIFSAHAVLSS